MKNPRKGFLNHTDFIWGLAGIAFVSLFFILSVGSSDFSYDRRNIDKPILSMVVLLTTSGVFYLWLVLRFKRLSPGKFWSCGIIFIGLLARFSLFPSTPILEDDYYRYLWDGGMVAHGLNPYLYSVQEVLEPESHRVPERLSDIAKEARPIPEPGKLSLAENHLPSHFPNRLCPFPPSQPLESYRVAVGAPYGRLIHSLSSFPPLAPAESFSDGAGRLLVESPFDQRDV